MNEPTTGIMFWIVSGIIVISSLLVVSLKNIFHCALFLILALFSVAGIFVMLHAEFLAAVQVLIYVGAVSILMIFSVMLTSNLASRKIEQTNKNGLPAALLAVLFVFGVMYLINDTAPIFNELRRIALVQLSQAPATLDSNIMLIGKLMMTEYMLPFEVVSILMLAAMIGAIVLARGERA